MSPVFLNLRITSSRSLLQYRRLPSSSYLPLHIQNTQPSSHHVPLSCIPTTTILPVSSLNRCTALQICAAPVSAITTTKRLTQCRATTQASSPVQDNVRLHGPQILTEPSNHSPFHESHQHATTYRHQIRELRKAIADMAACINSKRDYLKRLITTRRRAGAMRIVHPQLERESELEWVKRVAKLRKRSQAETAIELGVTFGPGLLKHPDRAVRPRNRYTSDSKLIRVQAGLSDAYSHSRTIENAASVRIKRKPNSISHATQTITGGLVGSKDSRFTVEQTDDCISANAAVQQEIQSQLKAPISYEQSTDTEVEKEVHNASQPRVARKRPAKKPPISNRREQSADTEVEKEVHNVDQSRVARKRLTKKPPISNSREQTLAGLLDLKDARLAQELNKIINHRGKNSRIACDKRRMNIISESLCNDTIQRLAPSLKKFEGCDIVDVNPGIGLFSSRLHDLLRPRTHILMDDDEQLYGPVLRRHVQTDPKSYQYLPVSGMIWNNLDGLHDNGFLPNQKRHAPGDPALNQRNNTLLLVANLGYHPPRPSRGFASIAALMIHQLISSIRHQSGVQRYGQVRMLIWMQDREKKQILPRSNLHRRKSSVEVEISCEDIVEVVGSGEHIDATRRDHSIDLEVAHRVRSRMDTNNIITPSQRQTELQKELEALSSKDGQCPQDSGAMSKPFNNEIQSSNTRASSVAQSNARRGKNLSIKLEKLLAEYDKLIAQYKVDFTKPGANKDQLLDTLSHKIAAWSSSLDIGYWDHAKFMASFADRLLARRDVPVLAWDRRPYEPLVTSATEFYPEAPMALLDLQPKLPWPVLQSSKQINHDTFEMILSGLFMVPTNSVVKGLKSLAPGADEWIVPRCPSLRDPIEGGCPHLDMLTIRMLSLKHLEDITKAWFAWPLAPSRFEMMRKYSSQAFDEDSGEGEALDDADWL